MSSTEETLRLDELNVGDEAPDFTSVDTDRAPFKLSDFRGRKNVLLLFYPFAFSGVCTSEFCRLRDENSDLVSDEDLEIVGVSCDPIYTLAAWKKAEGYPNRFVTDFWPHGAIAQKYGVFNAKAGLANRHAFLIDKDGKIALVQRNELLAARDQQEWRTKLEELRARG